MCTDYYDFYFRCGHYFKTRTSYCDRCPRSRNVGQRRSQPYLCGNYQQRIGVLNGSCSNNDCVRTVISELQAWYAAGGTLEEHIQEWGRMIDRELEELGPVEWLRQLVQAWRRLSAIRRV
jgi:hypothetical protein